MKRALLCVLLLSLLILTVSCSDHAFDGSDSTETTSIGESHEFLEDTAPDYSKFELIRNDIAYEYEKSFSSKEEYYSSMNDVINEEGVLEMSIRVYYNAFSEDSETLMERLDELNRSSKTKGSDEFGAYIDINLRNPVDAEAIETLSEFNSVRQIKITVDRYYISYD